VKSPTGELTGQAFTKLRNNLVNVPSQTVLKRGGVQFGHRPFCVYTSMIALGGSWKSSG